ncbi:MAG: GTP 3',8-cyclase MoaA [Gemmatimonadaceae bacterium]|nr:GTP 3',8-cyclase MoaA [Gemmatimonadaceae bacterium]
MSTPGRSFTDGQGRRIEYLRISVTDRCNFRCRYCLPTSGVTWLPREELLTYEEIAEVVRQVAPLGLRRIRITGGEPTIRPDLERLIALLRAESHVDDLSLSTNGVHLPRVAARYRAAGLDRVNMSADSLDPARAARIARRDVGFDPLRSLLAAEAAGLGPIKVNVVLLRGVNDDEIEEFARLTLAHDWHVRFIELMPVGDLSDLTERHIVPTPEVIGRISRLGALSPAAGPAGNGPARYMQLPRGRGTIGFITPMTHTYCASCNRVRLTADGRLRTCLFGTHEVDLRTPLRAGIPLVPMIHAALEDKPREHELLSLRTGGLRALSQVGG